MSATIQQIAADIASRIPAMTYDCAINNAAVIEGLIQQSIRPLGSEIINLREGIKAAQDLVEWLWEQDEMGYIVGNDDVAECGQCRGKGLRSNTYAIKHDEDCLQGKLVALKARLEEIMEGRR